MKKVFSSVKKGDYAKRNESNMAFYVVLAVLGIFALFEIFP